VTCLPYTKANGLNVYYEEHGQGEPLILLHGGTVSQAYYSTQIATLQKKYRVITPDLRGHGKTDNPYKQFSYRAMCEDLASLIDVLGIKRPLIFGYSDGGQVALELAMNYPRHLAALAIGGVFNKITKSYRDSLRRFGFNGPGDFDAEVFLENAPADQLMLLRSIHAPGPEYWKTLLQQLSYMWLTPLNYTNSDFRRVVVPTLVMVGDGDVLSPVEEAVKMFRSILGSELFVAPGCDHGFPHSRSGLLCGVLSEFFSRKTG
jgi:pimeloyl-ACP methyl ester carboxylesterase